MWLARNNISQFHPVLERAEALSLFSPFSRLDSIPPLYSRSLPEAFPIKASDHPARDWGGEKEYGQHW
jgi:hypothetical protein